MKWKKLTAWVLAGVLALGAAPGTEIFAAQEEAQAGSSQDRETEEGSIAEQEDWKPVLNYLYLTPAEQAESLGQTLVASLELEGRSMSEAALTWMGEDGSVELLEADEILEGYAVFVGQGVPILQEDLLLLEVTVDGQDYELDLEEFVNAEDTQIEEREPEAESEEAAGLQEEVSPKARNVSESEEELVEEVAAQDAEGIEAALQQAQIQTAGEDEVSKKARDGESTSVNQDVIIVLDPGHGGSDPGAVRTWNGVDYIEKDINLKISQYTKAELETYAGVRVYLTRDSDVAVGLEARVKYAADLGASVIVSQHINSTSKVQDTATGSLVFVASGNYRKEIAQQGWDVAGIILEELSKLGLKNNGLIKNLSETGNTYPNGKLADYYAIVRHGILYKVPGIIVEHAFVNNPTDAKNYFKSEASLKSLGVADATALARYFGLTKKDGSSLSDVNLSQTSYGWKQENGKWYYLETDNTRKKGFHIIDGEVYYFGSDSYRVTGWQDLEISRYYFQSNGVMSKYLTKVGKKYYYFNAKGWLMKGFFKGKGGKRYYSNKKGVLQTGWKEIKGKWYYFEPGTYAAATGLKKIEGKWYYFGPKGVMKTGWQTIDGDRYYFRSDGSGQVGWQQRGSKWYYISKKTGKMVKKKWVKTKKKYYYLNKNGVMLANTTRKIKGKKYRFNASGVCLNKKS